MPHIIFDFDGVIHDTFEIAYGVSYRLHGISKENYRDIFNGNIYQHKIVTQEDHMLFFEMQELEYSKLIIEQHVKKELLKMKEKYGLHVVSSNSEKTLKDYLNRNGIPDVFQDILGYESHHSKEEKFQILIKKYGLNRQNSVFVTDTLGDLREAAKVGLNAIAVDYGFHDRERLKKGNPIKIFSDFREILPSIEEIFG